MHPRGSGSPARSPCFLSQRLDCLPDGTAQAWGGHAVCGFGDLEVVWVAEGAEVKAACHLNEDGNRSRARQAYRQVMGGKEEAATTH